jgi:hypothetical protein
MKCRYCRNELDTVFCDLQTCPPSNSMVLENELDNQEVYYPLKVLVCENCWLVQVDEFKKASNIFDSNYTYFSSFSTSWLKHSKSYTNYMIKRFNLNKDSLVVEIASNDGYLLQYFKEKNIPVLGIEPTSNTAEVAIKKGIPTIIDFFGSKLSSKKIKSKANLILGNNVLAHVPNINDFIKGVKLGLSKHGVNTFEFPHLLSLIKENQFDTIYHEHFSYLSLTFLIQIFKKHGLEIFDVQKIQTHGGSLRIFSKHIEDSTKTIEKSVNEFLLEEESFGFKNITTYMDFQKSVEKIKYDFLSFLLECKNNNKKVIAYGAAAKGNTLLNYCGIKGNDFIEFVVDSSPHKQNKFLPGSRIKVYDSSKISIYKPDYIIIFPWNIKEEIIDQLNYCKSWGAKFVIAIPELKIF